VVYPAVVIFDAIVAVFTAAKDLFFWNSPSLTTENRVSSKEKTVLMPKCNN